MRYIAVFFLGCCFVLSGCASTITAWKSRPVAVHDLESDRFITMTGERRLALLVDREHAKQVAWCAESLPEASQAVSSSSKNRAQLTANSNVGSEDTFGTTLTQTFTRTEIAEIYRQMAWQACQAWAQGVFTNTEYNEKLSKILNAGIDVIKIRATQPLTPPAKPETGSGAAAQKNPNEKQPDSNQDSKKLADDKEQKKG